MTGDKNVRNSQADRSTPTLMDVARRAGVSRATASRVLNGVPSVSAEARRRVTGAVADLGYVTNTAAAALVTRRSGQVALIVYEGRASSDAVLAPTVRGVTAELSAAHLSCVVSVVPSGEDPADIARYVRTTRVDGAIVVADTRPDPLCSLLDAAGLPVTTLSSRSISPGSGSPGNRVRAQARRLVAHLAAAGR